MSERTPERCTVSIATGIDLAIEARVYRAVGDGPHPALALADGVARSAMCFADEGFTAIVFTEPDDYPSVVTWATTQGDIDDANLFAWCRSLDDLQALNGTNAVPRLRGAIVDTTSGPRNRHRSRCRRHLPRARTPVISYPVLVIVGGTEDYERLVRRMANRAHRIEVYVATSRARTVGVEIDFLRFHSGLPATMHEVC